MKKYLHSVRGYAIIASAQSKWLCMKIKYIYGGVAQLGERHTGSVEVIGSIPTVSTI